MWWILNGFSEGVKLAALLDCVVCGEQMEVNWVPRGLKVVGDNQRVGVAECPRCHATYEVWLEMTQDGSINKQLTGEQLDNE